MKPFSTTIAIVLTVLCLSAKPVSAQVAEEQAAEEHEAILGLASVTIGGSSFLLVVPPGTESIENDTVSVQSLAALLNFFLEIPVAPAAEGTPDH